ncbi:unnamed protein product [Merluccius merluccius]
MQSMPGERDAEQRLAPRRHAGLRLASVWPPSGRPARCRATAQDGFATTLAGGGGSVAGRRMGCSMLT